jgi:hypothetical protein
VSIYSSSTLVFIQKIHSRLKLDVPTSNSVDEDEALWLERAFEESEVIEVLKALNVNMASGPDGFSLAFSQSS